MIGLARIHPFLILAAVTLLAASAGLLGLCPPGLIGVQKGFLVPATRLAEFVSVVTPGHRPAPLTFYLCLVVILAIYVVLDRELTRLARRYGRAA